MTFTRRLFEAVRRKKTPVLVGLDPRFDLLPEKFKGESDYGPLDIAGAYERFCCSVIDVVAPLVPAVKPQAAFFEQCGVYGMQALANVIQHARNRGLVVILDGKRNDIGSTAEAYADGMLGKDSAWGADALTVSPYLGDDSLDPFVKTAKEREAGIFVLVKTSNPGGKMLQDLVVDGKTIYRRVAEHVQSLSLATRTDNDQYGSIGAVVGATWPEQLAELRGVMPNTWLLVPGFGSQGGSAKDVAGAFDANGLGAIINNSRGIIFAYTQEPYKTQFGEKDWLEAIKAATLKMIEQLRTDTPAGNL